MKKILLTLLCLIVVGITNNAATIEKSYKLEFATGSGDGTPISTGTVVADQLSKGSEYVTGNFTATTSVYGKSKFGLKLGKSAEGGTVAFDLSDAGKVKVTAITINGAHYNNAKDANMYIDVIINGNSVGHIGGFKQDQLSEKQLILESPVLAESLKFVTGNTNGAVSSSNQARGFIKDLTIEYVEDAEGAQDPIFSNLPENFTLTAGESKNFPIIDPSSLEYTFSVEPADLLTIDNENKTITANKIGTGTITFTTKEVEDTYNAGTGSFDVTVVGKRARISFANQVVIGKLGTGVVWQMADVTVPEGVLGDGELVTYESSDPSIVSINEDTGRIKSIDLHQAGEVTITATFTPNEEYSDYAPATARYTIIVKDPAAAVESGYSIFDFTTLNPYGLTSYSSGNNYEADVEHPVTEIVGDEDVVTISFDGNYRAWHSDKLDELRVMAGATMKIEVPEGYKISKIGFVKGSSWNLSYDPASKTIQSSDKISGDELDNDFDYVWMPASDAEPVSVVTMTSSGGRSDIHMIEVLYDAYDSGMKSADLSFTRNIYGIIVDEVATINAVNNPENREIIYVIDGLEENDYMIDVKDNNTLDIVVQKTGAYTLRATSAAGDGYRDGLAIMRLNVYRHVTVYKDDAELNDERIISGENGCYITMDIHPSLNLYYKLEETTKSEARAKVSLKAEDNEDIDENLEEGFEKYEDGIQIPAKHEGNLHFYLANYGYKSPVRTMSIAASDVNTAIEDIEATVDGEIRYYDLSGREVKGMPENGVYVRLQGGKADKVIVK